MAMGASAEVDEGVDFRGATNASGQSLRLNPLSGYRRPLARAVDGQIIAGIGARERLKHVSPCPRLDRAAARM